MFLWSIRETTGKVIISNSKAPNQFQPNNTAFQALLRAGARVLGVLCGGVALLTRNNLSQWTCGRHQNVGGLN